MCVCVLDVSFVQLLTFTTRGSDIHKEEGKKELRSAALHTLCNVCSTVWFSNTPSQHSVI